MTAIAEDVTRLTTYADVRAGLFNKDLARIGEEDVDRFVRGNMLEDALVTLHGAAHQERRRAETHLFSREVRSVYEKDLLPELLKQIEAGGGLAGTQDLVDLGRQLGVVFAARTAGIDFDESEPTDRDELALFARTFAEGAAIEDSLRPFADVISAVDLALKAFDVRFFAPSWDRRQALLDSAIPPEELPHDDLLLTLMGHREKLGLTRDMIRRETALFLAAGTDTTAQSVSSLIHEVFQWCAAIPGDRSRLGDHPELIQRFFHETLRVRPVVIVVRRRARADTQVGEHVIPAGRKVIIDLYAANCDTSVYGADATTFNPFRILPEGISSFGFAFSGGIHSCLGRALAGGAPLVDLDAVPTEHLYGIGTMFTKHLLDAGIRPADGVSGRVDETSSRWTRWLEYPVEFGPNE